MKKTLYITFLFFFVVILYYFTLYEKSATTSDLSSNHAEQQRYPWQIQELENGMTRVFNITLGETTFKQAEEILGTDRETGILINRSDQPRLEMYYPSFRPGPITGKLIIMADADPDVLIQMAGKLGAGESLETGVRKFVPRNEDLDSFNDIPVKQLSFLPIANLDGDIIGQRFGKASEVINIGELTSYYIFSEKGLVISLHSKSKDVIHYLRPKDMALFIEDLMLAKSPLETTTEPGTVE